MADGDFQVVFQGELTGEHPEGTVKQQIGALFKMSPERVEALFAGRPVTVKKGVDEATARKLEHAFRRAGAVCEVRGPTGETADPVTTHSAQSAAREPSQASAQASASSMAAAGDPNHTFVELAIPAGVEELTIDDSDTPLAAPTPAEPPRIDTSELELGPLESGALSPRAPPAPANIDTGDLRLEPLESVGDADNTESAHH